MFNFNTICFVVVTTLVFIVALWPHGAHSQDLECIQDAQPHYYVAEGTTKTPLTNELRAVLTTEQQAVWTNTFRTFAIVSIEHDDLAACNSALEVLTSQRNIPRKDPIHAVQSLSYQGRCLPTIICQ